jgi:hypothetical protein
LEKLQTPVLGHTAAAVAGAGGTAAFGAMLPRLLNHYSHVGSPYMTVILHDCIVPLPSADL